MRRAQEEQVEGLARRLLMADLRKAVVSGRRDQVHPATPLRKARVSDLSKGLGEVKAYESSGSDRDTLGWL